jgi:hypothetical protein
MQRLNSKNTILKIYQMPKVKLGIFDVIVTNPPDSDRIMYIDTVYVGSLLFPAEEPLSFESEIGIVMHRDSQPGQNATEVDIRNLNFVYPDNASLMIATETIQNPLQNQGPAVIETRQSLGLFPLIFQAK